MNRIRRPAGGMINLFQIRDKPLPLGQTPGDVDSNDHTVDRATAAAAARTLADPEAAAPTPPAQSPVRRHIPAYERMTANTCDAPPTPT